MKLISPRVHGLFDFVLILGLLVLPSWLHFSDTPRIIAYTLAGLHTLLVLFTAYPFGLVKIIPFTFHGAAEFLVAFLGTALPWIGGFADELDARNFFVFSGLGLFITWLLTDYKAAEAPSWGRHTSLPHAS